MCRVESLNKNAQFQIERQKIKEVQPSDVQDVVRMNVGGVNYMAKRSVLTQVKDSVMEAMFSGRHPVLEVDGMTFIEKDPVTFPYVLSYLRNE